MARVSLSEAYNDRSVIKKISDLEQKKQDKLTAGDGVILDGSTISVDTSELITKDAFATSQEAQDVRIDANAEAIASIEEGFVTQEALSESQALQDKAISKNTEDIATNAASIKSINSTLEEVDGDITQLETNVNLLDQRVSQHTLDINLVDDKVDDVASDLKLKANAADLVVTNSKVTQNTSDIATKASKVDLTATNAKVAQNTADILKRAMQDDLEESNTKISANTSNISSIVGQIGSATQPGSILYRITVSEDEIITLKPIVNEAIKSAVISGDGNAVYHTATTIGGTVDTDVLPTVSENRAGVMSSSVYVALNSNIANLMSRVALLEGESTIYPLTGMSDTPTDAQITSAFTTQYPNVPLSAGIRAADLTRAKVWAYTGSSWILMSGYTINQASTGVLGVVMGTADVDANAGRVYVESDGSMSVIGYDTLKALIVEAQGNIIALQTTVSGHATQITSLGTDVNALKLRMTNAETAISALQSSLGTTNTNLINLTKRVTQAESDIDNAEADIDALETRCGNIEEKDTAQDSSISTLAGRCDALETTTGNNSSKITALTTRVGTAESDIDNCESRLDKIEQSAVYNSGATKAKIDQITTNGTDIDNLETRCTNIEAKDTAQDESIASHTEQISSLNTDLTAAESDIDTLQTSVNEMATGVSNLGTRVSAVESGKQDKLTAGDNITIENNVISASGGGGSEKEWKVTSSKITELVNFSYSGGLYILEVPQDIMVEYIRMNATGGSTPTQAGICQSIIYKQRWTSTKRDYFVTGVSINNASTTDGDYSQYHSSISLYVDSSSDTLTSRISIASRGGTAVSAATQISTDDLAISGNTHHYRFKIQS